VNAAVNTVMNRRVMKTGPINRQHNATTYSVASSRCAISMQKGTLESAAMHQQPSPSPSLQTRLTRGCSAPSILTLVARLLHLTLDSPLRRPRTRPRPRKLASYFPLLRLTKLPLLPARDADMARGNQRDKAREKNLKDQAGKVRFPPGELAQ
jgi:hypothetical protein